MAMIDQFIADLIHKAQNGIPLDRSPELYALADKVANNPQPIPEDWAEKLAADLAQFND